MDNTPSRDSETKQRNQPDKTGITMATITDFDFRTGAHSYEEGEIWSEQDGPGPSTYYRNGGGRKIRLLSTRAVIDACWPWAHDQRRRIREGEFDDKDW